MRDIIVFTRSLARNLYRRNRVNDVEIINFNLYKERWNVASETTIKPGLESIQNALEKLGNPEDKHPIIHVAGTNGKGSTIAFLSALAKEHGLAYGSFTSPSILDVHDQIQINGVNVTKAQMDRAFQKVKDAGISGMLTDFELLTVVAYLVLEEESLDIVFIEVGMGGRWDSTNVMKKSISVIPSISIDHTNFLGESIEEISWHKAGIIKENSQLIMGPLLDRAKKVVLEEASKKKATVLAYGNDFDVQNHTYMFNSIKFEQLYPTMLGDHQLSNMALAITALVSSGISLNESAVQKAVKAASLPGRMEKVNENLYIDGAHNEASIDALVETIQQNFPNKKIHFIVGILKDKNYTYMLHKLEEVGDSFEFVSFHHERALPAIELYKKSMSSCKSKPIDIENLEFNEKTDEFITIITGSLYFINEIKLKTGKK